MAKGENSPNLASHARWNQFSSCRNCRFHTHLRVSNSPTPVFVVSNRRMRLKKQEVGNVFSFPTEKKNKFETITHLSFSQSQSLTLSVCLSVLLTSWSVSFAVAEVGHNSDVPFPNRSDHDLITTQRVIGPETEATNFPSRRPATTCVNNLTILLESDSLRGYDEFG